MVLLELLVEVRTVAGFVLVLPDYASKKYSASAELAMFCRRWNKIDNIVRKTPASPRSFIVSGSVS